VIEVFAELNRNMWIEESVLLRMLMSVEAILKVEENKEINLYSLQIGGLRGQMRSREIHVREKFTHNLPRMPVCLPGLCPSWHKCLAPPLVKTTLRTR
jgi:hypothetical protein